jgi:hypothetical protein
VDNELDNEAARLAYGTAGWEATSVIPRERSPEKEVGTLNFFVTPRLRRDGR